MPEGASRLDLRIDTCSGADREEMAGLTLEPCRLLELLDVDSVELVTAGSAPPGGRAGEMFAVGVLTYRSIGSPVSRNERNE